jgi:zinc transport system substrate-binding protein
MMSASAACESDGESADDKMGGPDEDSSSDEKNAPPGNEGPEGEHEEQVGERLLVTDAVDPIVRVIDVDDGEPLESFAIEAIARVYAGNSGRFGYAVQGEGDIVQVIDSGLIAEEHGDHVDLVKGEPRLLPFALEGRLPVHFVPHGVHVAAFFDDEGVAHVLDESTLSRAKPKVVQIDTGMPHHGVVLAFAERLLITTPELAEGAMRASPTGIAVFDEKGKDTGERFGPCPGLHGEAARADVVAFGCSDSVLLVFADGKDFRAERIDNPSSDLESAPRVGTLAAHADVKHFIGNFGPGALSKIDPKQGTITPVSVPSPYIQFTFDTRGEYVLLLTKDGKLHRLDVDTLESDKSIAVTTAPTDDTGHGAKYPQLAVGTEHIYVTDPDESEVAVVELATFEIERRIAVEGAPTKVAVLSAGAAEAH